MIQSEYLFKALAERGIHFFAGVPDSLLKDFCAYVTDHVNESHHVITANEGNAVALSAGYYLGTGQPSLVYLQNSGLGNTVNPLLSLNDPEVYGLPVLLMIGWRGEPGVKDEPQHIKQGRIHQRCWMRWRFLGRSWIPIRKIWTLFLILLSCKCINTLVLRYYWCVRALLRPIVEKE